MLSPTLFHLWSLQPEVEIDVINFARLINILNLRKGAWDNNEFFANRAHGVTVSRKNHVRQRMYVEAVRVRIRWNLYCFLFLLFTAGYVERAVGCLTVLAANRIEVEVTFYDARLAYAHLLRQIEPIDLHSSVTVVTLQTEVGVNLQRLTKTLKGSINLVYLDYAILYLTLL